jgi:hypothetical protein
VIAGTWTRGLVALALAAAGAGCNLLPGTSSDSPTTPSSTAITATFSGAIAPQGPAAFFTFTAAAGPVSVTLTSLSPSSVTGIGLGIGTPNGTTSCSLSNFTTSATASSIAQITVTETAGTYCAQVYDPGNLASTSTFTISVSHS